ncbi:Adenylate kinase 7 [Dissostichus eleginoides]|uniref:Adenylate kinase 7 n=1 Tax=Dissostichus eleginoides TaxID=100907 RepID=A0AAD9C4W7_DISEL|nr:Adenylate kinase 7 [Dissostichus eleginoides]
MDCDVVIYNITQHAEQLEEACWAASALHNEMERFCRAKMFILVSTVMTWACSKPMDPDVPFTDEIFWRRRAHPNFKQHIDLEKRVVKMGKTNRTMFSTYVVASGLQYGLGEQLFHFFFKTSWLGQEQEIPVFGDGSNIVPTIHIRDLASVIQNVIEHQPKPYYLLAVDSSNNTMEEILKAVSSSLGPGRVQKRPFEEAYLTQELSVMEMDSLLVNLRMEAVHLKELFSINWLCESGLVENMELVVEEYQQSRGLLVRTEADRQQKTKVPIRVCVLGPPAVGKSLVSRQICEHYKLHHITLKDTISQTITQLEDTVRNVDPDADNEDSAAEAKELLGSLKESMEQNGGLLEDHLLVKVVKDRLMSNPCRNQGFVLDGFPKTYEQAKELFYSEEQESEDGTSQISSFSRKIMPECVLSLDAHRENNMEDESVGNYFDELDTTPLYLEISSSEEPDCLLLMQKILDTLGQPRNYGPSCREVEEEERRKAEERMKREEQEREEQERREEEEATHRAASWDQWTGALEEMRQQEEELLEVQSVPMTIYLMEHVMPTLTQGLMECCTAHPQDPVDFLAEFLIRNNPFNY